MPEVTTPPLPPATNEPNPSPSTIGARLVAARKAAQKTRKQASSDLCIREDYLKCLENNDSAGLPPSPYDIGFLRQYARYLEIDPEPLVAEYKAARMLHFDTDVHHSIMTTDEQHNIWHSKWLLWGLGGAALLILIVAWLLDRGPAEEVTAIPAVEESATLLAKPEEAVALQVTTPGAEAIVPVEAGAPAAPATPPGATAQGPEAAALPLATVETVPAAEPAKPTVDPKRKPLPSVQAMKPEGARVRLEAASEEAWILVRPLHRNRTYVARSLPKGYSYWITPWQNIVLDTSHPQNLGVYVDGQYLGIIGPAGKEIAGLPLSPEALKEYFSKGENLNSNPVRNASANR